MSSSVTSTSNNSNWKYVFIGKFPRFFILLLAIKSDTKSENTVHNHVMFEIHLI